ncbi:hypothetical protein AAFF_G00420300 [Aldrovandia affinis]|uniref:Uncharacterized protein n=1 Tax=Aldrovandia affinis TaxID=143900 RepID=A0AAD7VYV8_9TELE|nr:hypothetical protein AAFF_G00420300 [Aldrovandia affinis]
MKVRAGARRLRWDPRPPARGSGAHHRPVSPALSGRWSVSACDRTRKMVNYAWAGRSQRKLWWRSAAVLTCKSVVRPGESGSDPESGAAETGAREASSAVTQPIPGEAAGAPGEFSFLCEGQGALEWVRPERGARALESVAVPAASGELSLALENPGEMV